MGNKKKKKVEKQNLFSNISITQINENPINNGTVVDAGSPYKPVTESISIYDPNSNRILFSNTYATDDYTVIPPLSFEKLRKIYNENHSVEETYQYLTDFIKSNRNNPDIITQTIAAFESEMHQRYDHNFSGCGVTSKEIFEQCLKNGDTGTVEGMICGQISRFSSDLLNDCGIPSATTPAIMNDRHAITIFRQDDGHYVFDNYGKFIEIEAPNVKKAIAKMNKIDPVLHSSGTHRLVNDKTTYTDFAFKDSAYRGREFSKHSYNNDNPFNNTFSNQSSLNGNFQYSNLGNTSAEISFDLANSKNNTKTLFSSSLGYVLKNNETEVFQKSESVGIGLEYKSLKEKPNSKNFSGITMLMSQVSGVHGGISYNSKSFVNGIYENILTQIDKDLSKIERTSYSEEQLTTLENNISTVRERIQQRLLSTQDSDSENVRSGNLSTYFRPYVGNNFELFHNNSLKLECATKVSGDILYCIDGTSINNHCGDYRITGSGGLQLSHEGGNYRVKSSLTGSLIGEYNEPIERSFDTFRGATRLNAGIQADFIPYSNSIAGISLSGYNYNSAASRNYGAEFNIFGATKDTNSGITFKAQGNVKFEKENIKMNFNEQTENNITFNALLSAQKGNTTVYAGYTKHKDNTWEPCSYSNAQIGVQFRIGKINNYQ